MKKIITERLILRSWKASDLEKFAEMNADPDVMKYFLSVKTFSETEAEYNRIIAHEEKYGFTFQAAELRDNSEFIGFIGLKNVTFDVPFVPAVEVGWRLAKKYWRQGYATEGALASLQYGFNELGLDEIVSFTTVQNTPSMGVMEKIGMIHDPKDDFDHPLVPKGHRYERHVLYRIKPDFILPPHSRL